ncbi:methyl-accepting chemotaxis protein [Vogesella sp. XCS3]|uniref:methyl-accepting chemotaxis protein n=1 Tax=Vogesella sp. XCS3 TaxID=2877939 RepID=UPI001D09CEB2|nr:methyl-accepting chemotaxis protein [Vogesella sp. XCS3]UDM17140.1 methyl-accepting chemotaxis protein [Vogesella sp. XCS3]
MKIATRLQLQTLVAVVAFATILLIAFVQLASIKEKSAVIADDVVPSIELLGTASLNFVQQRAALLSLVASEEAATQDAILAAYQNYRQLVDNNLQSYEALVNDSADKQLLEEFRRGVARTNQTYDQVLAAFKARDIANASQILNNSRSDFLQVRDTALKEIEHNKQVGREAHQALNDAEQSAMLWLAITAGVALLALVVIAIRTYRQIVGSIRNAASDIADMTEHLDLSRRCQIRHDDEMGGLLRHFNQLASRLHDSMQRVAVSSSDVASAAANLASAAGQVAAGSSAQSQSASSMAAALEQITVSINHVADRTQEANTLAQDTGHKARHGEQVIESSNGTILSMADSVHDVSTHMQALNQQTNAIHTVINVIRDVADQTNLLALNAAIEAARAGEMGRGFAVVADEVRKLAERTASSTTEIAQMINTMQGKSDDAAAGVSRAVSSVESGVQETERARLTMQEIAQAADDNKGVVGEIASAIREQGAAANSIAQQVETVAQMSEENASAAHSVTDLAHHLNELASTLDQEVRTYKL